MQIGSEESLFFANFLLDRSVPNVLLRDNEELEFEAFVVATLSQLCRLSRCFSPNGSTKAITLTSPLRLSVSAATLEKVSLILDILMPTLMLHLASEDVDSKGYIDAKRLTKSTFHFPRESKLGYVDVIRSGDDCTSDSDLRLSAIVCTFQILEAHLWQLTASKLYVGVWRDTCSYGATKGPALDRGDHQDSATRQRLGFKST